MSIDSGGVGEESSKADRVGATAFAALLDATDERAFRVDADHRFTEVSDGVLDLLGSDRATLLGSPLALALDDPEAVDVASASPGDPQTERVAVQTTDGRTVRCDLRFVPLAVDGERQGAVGVFRPVDERTRADPTASGGTEGDDASTGDSAAGRDATAEEFEEILRRVTDATLVLDDEWRITNVVGTVRDLVDQPAASLQGQRFWEAFPATVDSPFEAAFFRAKRTQEPTSVEAPYEPLDVWMQAHVYPTETGLSVYVIDVTDGKRQERELERYETIVETVTDGIYAVDGDGRFIMVNEAYTDMVGYSREALLGEHVSMVANESTIESAAAIEEDLREGTREAAILEAPLETADGETVVAEAAFSMLDSVAGTERVAVVRDVAERTAREEMLRRQRDQLAALTQLNAVVSDVNHALVQRSSRSAIGDVVTDRLVDSESYELAWIGEYDSTDRVVRARESAGPGSASFEDFHVNVEDPASCSIVARAIDTGEMQVSTADVVDCGRCRTAAAARNCQSIAVIPIAYEGVQYGVLALYARRPDAFDGRERTVVGRLGEIIGHAITALERKEALVSERVLELEFRSGQAAGPIRELLERTDATVTIERTIPAGDAYLHYVRVVGLTPEQFEEAADRVEHFEKIRLVGVDDEGLLYSVVASNPVVARAIATRGGRVLSTTLDADGLRVVAGFPHGVDPRAVRDALREAVPDVTLVGRRSTTTDDHKQTDVTVALDRLTTKQRATLEAAVFGGYFEWPRESTAEELAASMNVSSPTFHQHLRKAQRKLLSAFFTTDFQSGIVP